MCFRSIRTIGMFALVRDALLFRNLYSHAYSDLPGNAAWDTYAIKMKTENVDYTVFHDEHYTGTCQLEAEQIRRNKN